LPKHAFRRFSRWAWVLTIFAVGIPISTALAVRHSGASGRLREVAVAAIQEELGLRATLGHVQLELFPFGIVARDVALDDPVYGRLADAEILRVQPSLRGLLRGVVDLSAIEIEDASVRLVVSDGEVRNLPRLETPDDGGPPTLPFRELRIVRSTLTVDASPHAAITARDVNVTVRGAADHVIEVDVSAGGGEVTHETGTETIEAITASVRAAQDHLEVREADLRIGPLALRGAEVRLPLPPPTDPRHLAGIAGHVELDYDLAHLGTLRLPITLPRLEGRVHLVADVPDAERPEATGQLVVEGGRIEQFGLGDRVELELAASPDEVRVTRGRIDVASGGGTVGLTARLGLGPTLPLVATASPDGLSFAHLMEVLGVTPNSIVEWLFDGTLQLEGELMPADGRLRLAGPVELHTHDFVVSFDPYHERPVRPVLAISRGRFLGSWSIDDTAVRFHDLVADLPRSRIWGDVVLGFRNELRVSARTEGHLEEVAPLAGFDIRGAGRATCTIDGTFQDPRVGGTLDFEGFEFDGMRIGRIASDAELDRDGMGVTFPEAHITKGDSRYVAHGLRLDFHEVGGHGAFALDARLELGRLTLADFYHVFGFEEDERFNGYQGVAHGLAIVRYTNGHPGDSPSGTLLARADLSFDAVSLNGYAFERGTVRGTWRWNDWSRGYRGGELTLDEALLHKGEGTLLVAGEMAEGGTLRMNAAVDRVALRDLEGIGDRLPDVGGVASAIGVVSGDADRMRVDLDVLVTEASWAGRALGDARAYVRMTDDLDPWVIAARDFALPGTSGGTPVPEAEPCPFARRGLARAGWPADPPARTIEGPQPRLSRPSAFVICGHALEDRVALDLMVGRTERFPVRGRIAATALPIETLAGPDAAARGTLTGELLVEDGGPMEPERLDARLVIDEVELRVGPPGAEVRIASAGPVRVSIDDGVARIERARFRAPGSRLRVRGQASVVDGLGLEIASEVDLSLLPSVNPSVTAASGRLAARLAVTGPFVDPQLFGEAIVEGGRLELPMLSTPVEDLEARIGFSSRRIVVEEVAARLAGGHVFGSGEATIERRGIERWDIDVRAEHLSFEPVEGLAFTVSAELDVTGRRDDRLPRASGDVIVERMTYSRPIALGATLDELTRTERAEVETWRPSEEHLDLDLRVLHDAPFVVRNDLVDAELRVDEGERPFRIVGTDQRFGVLGDLRFERGRIFFRNNSFEIVPGGSVVFDDETSVDPSFDVRASTTLRRAADLREASFRVLLEASGTSDSLRIVTHSEPELPQEDILLLLAVGMTRAEVEAQAGSVGSTAALEALASVTGVDREVRRALPVIDDFRLGSAYSVRTGRTEPQITIGKRIADRIRLSATTGISESRDFRALLEAQLDDTTSVSVGYDNYNLTGASFGNFGADLRWRLEFE